LGDGIKDKKGAQLLNSPAWSPYYSPDPFCLSSFPPCRKGLRPWVTEPMVMLQQTSHNDRFMHAAVMDKDLFISFFSSIEIKRSHGKEGRVWRSC
jgi:hypothetical protein